MNFKKRVLLQYIYVYVGIYNYYYYFFSFIKSITQKMKRKKKLNERVQTTNICVIKDLINKNKDTLKYIFV